MHLITLFRISTALLFGLYLDAAPAAACECIGLPTCQTLWSAELVFVGTARVSQIGPGKEEAQFELEEWLRGERVGQQVTLISEGIGLSCDYNFESGVRYVVFASRSADGSWKASCATAPLSQAVSTVDYIRRVLRSREPGNVSGDVTFDADPSELLSTGPPIASAPVRLRSTQREFATTTNVQGAFRFERVPPGEYSLVVELPKNAVPFPPMKVVVGADACVVRYIFVGSP